MKIRLGLIAAMIANPCMIWFLLEPYVKLTTGQPINQMVQSVIAFFVQLIVIVLYLFCVFHERYPDTWSKRARVGAMILDAVVVLSATLYLWLTVFIFAVCLLVHVSGGA